MPPPLLVLPTHMVSPTGAPGCLMPGVDSHQMVSPSLGQSHALSGPASPQGGQVRGSSPQTWAPRPRTERESPCLPVPKLPGPPSGPSFLRPQGPWDSGLSASHERAQEAGGLVGRAPGSRLESWAHPGQPSKASRECVQSQGAGAQPGRAGCWCFGPGQGHVSLPRPEGSWPGELIPLPTLREQHPMPMEWQHPPQDQNERRESRVEADGI